jgi:hypothetical protein
MKIGLAEVGARRTLKNAKRIYESIELEREKRDNQEMREFVIDYKQKFFFRLLNVGWRDAFFPKDVEDLDKVTIDGYLLGMYRYGWKSNYAWRDMQVVEEIMELAIVAETEGVDEDQQTIYINQEQARVLNLR